MRNEKERIQISDGNGSRVPVPSPARRHGCSREPQNRSPKKREQASPPPAPQSIREPVNHGRQASPSTPKRRQHLRLHQERITGTSSDQILALRSGSRRREREPRERRRGREPGEASLLGGARCSALPVNGMAGGGQFLRCGRASPFRCGAAPEFFRFL